MPTYSLNYCIKVKKRLTNLLLHTTHKFSRKNYLINRETVIIRIARRLHVKKTKESAFHSQHFSVGITKNTNELKEDMEVMEAMEYMT